MGWPITELKYPIPLGSPAGARSRLGSGSGEPWIGPPARQVLGNLGGAGPEPEAGRGRRGDGFGTFLDSGENFCRSAFLRFGPSKFAEFLLLAFVGRGAVRAAKAKPTEVLFSRERTWFFAASASASTVGLLPAA